VLVHVLDLAPLDGTDPADNHATIEAELAAHSPELAGLPRVLALSKADLVPPEDAAAARELWREELGADVPVLLTSSATGQGLDELRRALLRAIPPAPPVDEDVVDLAEHRTFRPARGRGYEVKRSKGGTFRVTGPGIDTLLARYDLENEEALAHLERVLRSIGVIAALEDAGFEPGDEVELAGVAFDLDPGA
jgi:GTP-binding protein